MKSDSGSSDARKKEDHRMVMVTMMQLPDLAEPFPIQQVIVPPRRLFVHVNPDSHPHVSPKTLVTFLL